MAAERDKLASTHVVRENGTTGRAWAVAAVATVLLGVWIGGSTSALEDSSANPPKRMQDAASAGVERCVS